MKIPLIKKTAKLLIIVLFIMLVSILILISPRPGYRSIPYSDGSGNVIIMEYQGYAIPSFINEKVGFIEDAIRYLANIIYRKRWETPIKSWLYNVDRTSLDERNYKFEILDGFFGGYQIAVNPINDHVYVVRATWKNRKEVLINRILELKPDGSIGIQYEHPIQISNIQISSDGKNILVVDEYRSLYTIDTISGESQSLPAIDEYFTIGGLFKDKLFYYSLKDKGSEENGIYVINIEAERIEQIVKGGVLFDISEDGKFIVFGKKKIMNKDKENESEERSLYLYSVETDKILDEMPYSMEYEEIMFQPGASNISFFDERSEPVEFRLLEWNEKVLFSIQWPEYSFCDRGSHQWISHSHYMFNAFTQNKMYYGKWINTEVEDTSFINIESGRVLFASEVIKNHKLPE